jgi:uncharacterized protein (DUF433 family)
VDTPDPRLARIQIDPKACHGQPCVKGTRVLVSLVVQYLAGGDSIEEVLEAYPGLEHEDVMACLAYAAEMTRERVLPIDLTDRECA